MSPSPCDALCFKLKSPFRRGVVREIFIENTGAAATAATRPPRLFQRNVSFHPSHRANPHRRRVVISCLVARMKRKEGGKRKTTSRKERERREQRGRSVEARRRKKGERKRERGGGKSSDPRVKTSRLPFCRARSRGRTRKKELATSCRRRFPAIFTATPGRGGGRQSNLGVESERARGRALDRRPSRFHPRKERSAASLSLSLAEIIFS